MDTLLFITRLSNFLNQIKAYNVDYTRHLSQCSPNNKDNYVQNHKDTTTKKYNSTKINAIPKTTFRSIATDYENYENSKSIISSNIRQPSKIIKPQKYNLKKIDEISKTTFQSIATGYGNNENSVNATYSNLTKLTNISPVDPYFKNISYISHRDFGKMIHLSILFTTILKMHVGLSQLCTILEQILLLELIS